LARGGRAAELTEEGKQRRRFGANLMRAAVLRRSLPMHGLCEEGRKGVSMSFGAERGRRMKEGGGGHQLLLTKRKKGKWGGGVRRGRYHAEEDSVGGGW
jgi:hypothetical protein